jgi:hypothetical protein
MITGAIKSQIDQIWNAFWSGGISNPLEVIEQITYLLFLRRLDDLHTLEENKSARLPGPSERQLRHPQPLISDVRGGNADDGQPLAHRVRKHRAQALRFGDRKYDRKSRPFADEKQVLTSVDPEDVAVPVSQPGRGLDGRQVADLFQPDEQPLRAPENDHQFVSLPYDIVPARSRARWPARS